MSQLPEQARLVIVGAGIVGCSAAYHLAQLGWRDIVVIDQGPLYETGGSTSHAPGITFGTNPSRLLQKMVKYTTDLLHGMTFQEEPVWFPVGTVEVATTEARMQELWRRHGHALAFDAESHIITPAEVQALVPLVDADAILGGLQRPSDGNARAWQAAGALAEAAGARGAVTFHAHTTATDFEKTNGRVTAVITDKGRITCEQVLLCTNIWGPVLADKVGVTLPMMACAHHYAISEPLPELAHLDSWIEMPPLRHQDRSMYFRQWGNAWSTGSYRHTPRLVDPYAVGRDAFWDWNEDDWAVAVTDAEALFPALKGRDYVKKINGMFVFSTDGFPLMGPTQVPGFWTAIGIWVTHAGGAGKLIAEWLAQGHTEWDVHEADVNRFHAYQRTPHYIRARSWQNYAEVYDIIHPKQQMEDPRNVRLAPYHTRLNEHGGHFWSASGWEVAQWYAENDRLLELYDEQIPHRSGWEAVEWSRIQGAEHLAVRDSAGLFNLANFTKLEITGPGSEDFLNYLAANDVAREPGAVIYTALLDTAGGIKSDLTITRLDPDRYWILTGAGGGPHDSAWIRRHLPVNGSVSLRDVTSHYTAVGLWGPNARRVLQSVAAEDVSDHAFPYMSARRLSIQAIPVLALRLSYAGELGWEIYCAAEQGLALWDILWEAGRSFDLIAAGAGAFGSLRLEKGYRAWGQDIHTEFNPYEAGLGWAVRLNKGEFSGRDALLRARVDGPTRKLCCLTSSEPGAIALGSEPIMSLSGEKLGFVTSADYGYSVGTLILFGYLPVAYAAKGTQVRVHYFDKQFTAVVDDDPLFDPAMTRLRA